MRVIITAGGTTEKIDEVGKIKNTGIGKLRSLVSDAFIKLSSSRAR